jgi:DNA-binding transcriptional LysR family regulator
MEPQRYWTHLNAFMATARHLSFSQAAQSLDISPQAVSVSIARLEEQLGVRLFNRTTRSVLLTAEGEALFAAARHSLGALGDAMESIAQADRPRGLIRMSVASGFARRYVLPLIPVFQLKLPEVHIDITSDDRAIDPIREGFDIVIRGGRLVNSSLVSRKICALYSVLVASPAYLRKHGVPRRAADLESHQLIGLRFLSGERLEWQLREGKDSITLTPSQGLYVSDPDAVMEAAQLGCGIGAVAIHHAIEALRAQRLKVVLPRTFQSARREMAILYPHRQWIAPRVKAVVALLLESFAANSDLHLDALDLSVFAA